LQNFAEISKFCEKGQIVRLGSEIHSPWKTVGPTDDTQGVVIVVVVVAVQLQQAADDTQGGGG